MNVISALSASTLCHLGYYKTLRNAKDCATKATLKKDSAPKSIDSNALTCHGPRPQATCAILKVTNATPTSALPGRARSPTCRGSVRNDQFPHIITIDAPIYSCINANLNRTKPKCNHIPREYCNIIAFDKATLERLQQILRPMPRICSEPNAKMTS